MKQKSYCVSAFFDARTTLSGTDKSPVTLAISLKKSQFRVGLKLYATKNDFKKAMSGKSGSDEVKELRQLLNGYIAKAEIILERLLNPDKETFIRLFKSETDLFVSNKTDAYALMHQQIIDLNKEGRFSSAISYKLSMSAMKKFKPSVFLEDIDIKFLKDFKASMIERGNSNATANIYLRNLKRIFNIAIKAEIISSKFYPFKNFSIASSAKSKEVLYPAELKALYNYVPIGIREERAKDFFIFCYLCNGMNFKDVAVLKFKNVKGDILTFVREKTKNTTIEDGKEINCFLHDEAKKIIEKWKNDSTNPNDYIFPFLNNCRDEKEIFVRHCTNKRNINKALNVIGKKLGFENHLCLKLARHSFATRLKLNGTPIAFITDALGHSSSKTTEHYLKSIPTDAFKAISDKLLQFD